MDSFDWFNFLMLGGQTIGFPFPLAASAVVGDALLDSFRGVSDIADPWRFVVFPNIPDIARPLFFRGAMMAVDVHAAALRASSRTRRGWSNCCQRWSRLCFHSVFSLASVPALFPLPKSKKYSISLLSPNPCSGSDKNMLA